MHFGQACLTVRDPRPRSDGRHSSTGAPLTPSRGRRGGRRGRRVRGSCPAPRGPRPARAAARRDRASRPERQGRPRGRRSRWICWRCAAGSSLFQVGGTWSGVGCTPSTASPSTTTECQPANGPPSVSSTARPPSIAAQNSASRATSEASRTVSVFVMRTAGSSGAEAVRSRISEWLTAVHRPPPTGRRRTSRGDPADAAGACRGVPGGAPVARRRRLTPRAVPRTR